MGEAYDFEQIHVTVDGQVAVLYLLWPDGVSDNPQVGHRELAEALAQIRNDDNIRVLVITGATDARFYAPFAGRQHPTESGAKRKGVMSDPEHIFAAIRETQEIIDGIARMEKPVIARVNGDALGFGASLALVCDFVIADEEAHITDIHIANHHFVPTAKRSTGIVPGDGGVVLWPLQMSLVKAKEFLMTGRPVRARELADMNVITRAVPKAQLQETVDEYVEELLARPAWALGWTKLVINKRMRADLELALDASAALEAISMRVRDDFPGPKGTETL